MAYLTSTHESAKGIANYVSGIKSLHALAEYPIPDSEDYKSKILFGDIRREKIYQVKQAAPMTPDLLMKISYMVKYSDHVELVAWCMVLLGFTMFLRSSNLVPQSANLFIPGKQLTRANLTVAANLLMAHIRWSKVIQYRQQDLKVPILPFPDNRICPVFWYRNMLQKIPGKASDPLLAVYIKGRAQALSYNQLSLRLHKWLVLIVTSRIPSKNKRKPATLHENGKDGTLFGGTVEPSTSCYNPQTNDYIRESHITAHFCRCGMGHRIRDVTRTSGHIHSQEKENQRASTSDGITTMAG